MSVSVSAGYTDAGWNHGNWFAGFWVGLLAAGYIHTGNPALLAAARDRQQLVAMRAEDPNTHDIGFLFWSSAIPLHRETGEARYAQMALAAARQLRRRLVLTRTGAYLASWGPLTDPRARVSSAIDTMANLPLLYWAGAYSGDASFTLAAEAHARLTASSFIRPDASTYHAVEYDLPSGRRRRGYTFQGFRDESTWSRGQAWAVYGYAATAAATGNPEYARTAARLADHFLERAGEHPVPFWDFDDPAIPDAPRDSSAAAILASALLELAAIMPDREEGERWRDRAMALLEALCADYLAREPGHRGILKHGCYSRPHREGVDSAVLFGDYFFAEALCRAVYPDRLHALSRPLRPE
jgi:unsaturated chondroitin disaccharide hydrolase